MVGSVPVGHEALQAADAYSLTSNGLGAVLLALLLLGADTAADSGQGTLAHDDLIGPCKVPLRHPLDEGGDPLANGTARGAGLFPAFQAAHGLPNGVHLRIPQVHLIEVGAAALDVLLGHGGAFSHIVDHFASPSFGSRLSRRLRRLS